MAIGPRLSVVPRLTRSAVEVLPAEEHELVGEQLDPDPVRVAQVERLRDAPLRTVVRDPVLVQLLPQRRMPVRGYADRDVLDGPDALLGGLQPQAGEVEEPEECGVAEIEEEVRRAGIVAVLGQLDERKAEESVVELDRLLDIAADEGGMVDAARV